MPAVGKKAIGPALKKKTAPKKIVVKQTTINKIKGMGMTSALKKAGTSSNAEFVEGVKRMYGARRLSASKGSAADKRITKPSLRPDKPVKVKGGGGRAQMR